MHAVGAVNLPGPLSPNFGTGLPSVVKTWTLLFEESTTAIFPSSFIQMFTGRLNSPSPSPYFPKLFTKFPVCTLNC